MDQCDPETFFTVPEQVMIFLGSVLIGTALGAVYDIFRVIRVIFPRMGKRIPTAAADILYFVIFAGVIFMYCAINAGGGARGFCIAGAVLGAALYIFTVGDILVGILRDICSRLRKHRKDTSR